MNTNKVLFALGMAMGVAALVINLLDAASAISTITLLAIGVAAVGLAGFRQ